ncbi:uncharacterized protein LOC129600262 [Paramacrobiotus metropolitanus]|uniref:uncharacterized protein LOC129600262 n=1 Tax=Paramacrobiotus metropolitanus TaxID=2943436 RepID=UPI002445C826|nr:uncharacterized protein LOC129600262 [Paramacrobiotus metropolitanus]
MLLYRDYAYFWNSVDVLVDGRLQHGEIVNLAEGGLIIDFGCAGQRSQFVAFGTVFRCLSRSWGEARGDAVQVLLRPHPDAPWTWFPGKTGPFAAFGFGETTFVQVQLPHGTVEELVRWKQVRPALTDGDYEEHLRVVPNEFVIRACPLLVAYNLQLGEILKAGFSQRYRVLCTSLLSQTLLYLQRQDDTPLTAKQVQKECDLAMEEQARACSLPSRQVYTVNKKRTVDRLPVPAELLVEIFRSLDSVQRVRCRRVCHVWNALLTNAAYFPDVRVSGGDADYGPQMFPTDGVYWVLECLFKCLTSATRMMVITSLPTYSLRHLAAPINRVFNAGRKLPLLVLFQCVLGDENEYANAVLDDVARLAGTWSCERVLWKKCRILSYLQSASVAQHVFSIRSREDVVVQLWDCFEEHQTVQEPLDLPAVAKWIADSLAHQRDYQIQGILWELNHCQSPDPRPTTHYRGVKWTVSNISDLDASKLTTLTVTFLNECMKHSQEPLPLTIGD